MRILHLTPAYPPAEFPTGPPQQVHRLARALRADGVDVRVVTTNGNGKQPLDVPTGRWVTHDDVPVYYGRRIPGTADLSWDTWRTIRNETRGADVVHVTYIFSWINIAASSAARRHHRPLVVSPRGSLDPKALTFSARKKAIFFRLGGWRALDQASAFHVTSEMERGHVAALFPRARFAVVPNGVALPTEEDLARWTRTPPARRTILFMGRIHPKKNVLPLVEAWAAVAPRHPDAELVLAGPDDHGHQAEVERAIGALGVTASVRLTGHLGGEDLGRLLASSSALVLPSRTENFGNVVTEALAHRVPVIASTGTPWSGLVERDCGWWVDPNVEALSAAIDVALRSEAARLAAMGARGRRWMTEEFSWPSFARRMAAFYLELSQRG